MRPIRREKSGGRSGTIELAVTGARLFSSVFEPFFCLNSVLMLTPTLKTKVEPLSEDSTVMSPLSRLIIFLLTESPRPTPLGFRCALHGRVTKSLKSL